MKKLRVTINGVSYNVDVEVLEDDDLGGTSYGFPTVTSAPVLNSSQPVNPVLPTAPVQNTQTSSNAKELISPIAGIIVEVKASIGANIKEGEVAVIIEAMKMNTNINSPVTGKVKDVKIKSGDSVQQGQVLVTFE